MKSRRRLEWAFVALLSVAMSTGAVLAQDEDTAPPPPNGPQQQDDQGGQQQMDPPGRVARVEYMSGEVSTQPGGVNDWVAASQNRPLTTSDRIWTDKNSRAELNVGDGFIRMNSETSLTLSNISDNTIQMELDQGTLSLTVRHLSNGEVYEVDTPNYAFTVMKAGVYRFDVYPSQDQSVVTVRSGYGQATGDGSAVRVNSGTQVRFSNGNSLQHVAMDAPARDGFEDWAKVRDKRLDESVSARYVSPGVIGYQDLDNNGTWVQTPSYGPVWQPYSVPAGWAPYRYGHWAWIAPWGWTWVDDASWGFAPFHYGRWVTWGGGWAWAPGPIGYWNPYYAPALVGWVGGPGFGIGFGFGGFGFGVGVGFGWFPLGWGEPYYPRYCGWGHGGWYRGGGYVTNRYFRNVNVTNTHITNINNFSHNYYSNNMGNTHFGFRNRPGAVTAAPNSAFSSGASINRVGGAVPNSALGKGTLMRGADVNPTRESVLGGRTAQTRGIPPASANSRSVVSSSRPGMRPANVNAANQATTARSNPSAAGTQHGNLNGSAAERGNRNMGRNQQPTAAGTANNAARGPASTANSQMTHSPANTPANSAGREPTRSATGSQMQNRGNVAQQSVPRPSSGVTAPARTNSQNNGRTPVSSSPAANGRSVPRPPAGYSYHPAPAYSGASPSGGSRNSGGTHANPGSTASPNYGANRSMSPSYNTGRGAYASTPNYSARRSYGASPSYSNRSSASPSYSSRSYGPSTPSYSGRSYGSYGSMSRPTRSYGSPSTYANRSYSAPRSSGGGSSHGGGGHSSGGGGGGHHGR